MCADNNLRLGKPIPHSQAVQASQEQVWKAISEPGNLVNFHPFCERNPVDRWPGVGSRDRIFYYNGLVLVRDFTDWIEGQGYDLVASAEEGLQFKVTWRILKENVGTSFLNLTIYQVLDQETDRKVQQYSRLLAKYLQQVGQGFEYYLHTGERVTRNQFGAHRLFSPPVVQNLT
jgi:hypothetical protein